MQEFMKNDDKIILSIIIICHNQRTLLARCFNSILRQQITFPYEIIISDDRSTDGSWELIQHYEQNYPGLVFGLKVNSDECNPVNTNERCGFNKVSSIARSRGKYFVTIDSDDFLKGTDIYQIQVEMLEMHPDCSMCMQNIWRINDGDELENGQIWGPADKYEDGHILTPAEVILNSIIVLNQGYVNRRYWNIDPLEKYGKHFDDRLITYFQLQYGNVVYLNRHDYVYVKYAFGIDNNFRNDDREIVYNLLPVYHALFIPRFAGMLLYGGLSELIHLFRISFQRNLKIGNETLGFLAEFEGFIFRYYEYENPGILFKMRLLTIRLLALTVRRFSLGMPCFLRLLFALITSSRQIQQIPHGYWMIK
jgi:glycosyltransferase involved in cell wall biosynthesis